jgi:hypothetical protein
MIRYLTLAVLLPLSSLAPLGADTLYRCQGLDGVPLFANQPCDEHSEPVDLPEIGVIGSDDGGAELQRRVNAMARITGIEPPKRKRGKSAGLSFGERMTLRQLEIRRDGLRRDIGNQGLASPYRKSLADELALVERRIRELEKRR